jgi:phage replication initiation protein
MGADGGFSPVGTGEKGPAGAIGPGSNTGQKGGALIDFLTVVLPVAAVEERRLARLDLLVATLFGTRDEIKVGAIRARPWQFYPQSAVIVDRDGELVGRIGLGGNGDTICVSLSGAGTRWVRNWGMTERHLADLGARISRVDLAFDDYEGDVLNVHDMRERALAGEFCEGGRPPRHRFLSDEGHGTGSTLYVGGKGHKELCVYEKGKQLGVSESPWVRAEVRMYGKHTVLPLDVLTRPLAYLRGAYSALQELLIGECTRLKTVRKAVETTGEAMVRYLHRQVGPSLNLLRDVFGADWAAFAEERITRHGRPGRFRGIASGDELAAMLRSELCPASS